MPNHVLGDGRLRNLEPQFDELTVNPRSAPQWVRNAHLSDETLNLLLEFWSSRASPAALPCPMKLKALPRPRNDGLGLHDHQGLLPVRPATREPNPQETI